MKPLEILIVDDVESIRHYLKEILKPLNVFITEAGDGDLAFELIQQNEYDLILMDVEMPGKSGIEVTKRVRKQLGFNFTPIIVMTGLQDQQLIHDAFECGASDYISKPLSETEVITRIQVRLENRRINRELRLARKSAENANKAKSIFMTHLAHELKTPLNAINGFAQLIQADSSDPGTIENTAYIIGAAQHQEKLINEVNNLVQIEAGVINIDLSDIDLSTVIKEAFGLLNPLADKFKISLNLPRRSDLMYTVTADGTKLKQVFINLISNAIKYNQSNGEVSIHVKEPEQGLIKVGITDTGHGIAESDIPKLFESFNRLGAENTDIEGTGIGLPITKNIVELMGGALNVDSTKGQGSTFWVELVGHKTNT